MFEATGLFRFSSKFKKILIFMAKLYFGPNTRNYKVISIVQIIEKYWKGISWKVIKR